MVQAVEGGETEHAVDREHHRYRYWVAPSP